MKYISSIKQLNELIATGSKEPILVGGELLLATYERADILNEGVSERYVAQPPRTASRKNLFSRAKTHLYLGIDRAAITILNSYPGSVMIAADQYLAYGLQQSATRDVIVMGGGDNGHGGYIVEGMVFTNQQLVHTFDRVIHSANHFELNLLPLAQEYPDHEILWCEPLPVPPKNDFTSLRNFKITGGEALANSIKRKIFIRSQGEHESWGLVTAAIVAALGFSVFAGVYAYQSKILEAEKSEFRSAVQGYEKEYADSAHTLQLLTHRKYALTEDSSSVDRVELLNLLVAHASSIADAIVDRVSVFSDEAGHGIQKVAGAEEFMVELSVPKSTNARQQAKPILAALSSATGMSVQVIEHRADGSGKDSERWFYKIGGQYNAE